MLSGKVAIVTGASRARGMGRATAIHLAEAGADVVITDIAPDGEMSGFEEVLAEIEQRGVRGMAQVVDVTEKAQIVACVEAVVEKFGRIDILFNNAGIGVMEPFLDTTDETWEQIFRINLKGVSDFCQAVLPTMMRQHSGSIINNASAAGLNGSRFYALYCAVKFGVVGLTQSLAKEFGHYNIRVNATCPGFIDTQMHEMHMERIAELYDLADAETAVRVSAGSVALKRVADPSEVANLVAFLASDEASYMTGAAIPITGG
ncbi:MAG: SDR family NAD(P)-dependent oxidoreductase [Chloroflexota bacterium]